MILWILTSFSSVQFSCSVMSDSLKPHEPQHMRLPCPSPTARVHPNQCPLSQWCHPTISSSVVPFSSCPQSFSASGSFQMSQLFASGGQNIGISASTSVLPMNTQDWTPLGWTGWISLQSKGLSSVLFWHLFFLLFFVMLKAATDIFQCASKSIKKIYFPKLSYQKKANIFVTYLTFFRVKKRLCGPPILLSLGRNNFLTWIFIEFIKISIFDIASLSM